MSRDEFYEVGRVKDAHGLKGELYIHLFSGEAEWLNQLKRFRLQSAQGVSRDLEVKKVRPHKQGLIIWPEGFENRNQSEACKGAKVLIPIEYVTTSKEDDDPYLREILGFEVIDERLGRIGKITGFLDNGAHALLTVKEGKNEYEVPYVDALIKRLDREAQCIYMDLPEGLIN